MFPRFSFITGILLLTVVTTGLLYELYRLLNTNAAVSMWKLSSTIQSGIGMDYHNFAFNTTAPALKRIAVVMSIHEDTALYRAAVENHRKYCELHGYRFMSQSKDLLPQAPFSHSKGSEYQKMAVLMHAVLIGLNSGDFDWVLWTDLDTFVVNPSIPLESLLPPSSSSSPPPERDAPYFLGNQDHHGFNAGSFFIRVTPWSVQLLAMAMAEPYNVYQTAQDNTSSKAPTTPAFNDQASLSRIFSTQRFFGRHFHEIPAEWANHFPAQDLDDKLETDAPHLIPESVETWVHKMEQEAAGNNNQRKLPRAAIPPSLPPPLDGNTLAHLKSLLSLPSTFLPADFAGALQVHLVNYRKYQFYYNSLVVINAKYMQVGLAALVVRYHEALAYATNGTVDAISLWRKERDSSVWGMRYIQPAGLEERQTSWYRARKAGIEGMRWLTDG